MVRIDVHKTPGTRYRSTLTRDDGVELTLEGGSWNRIGGPVPRVPHDLAHLVVERELGVRRGLWGTLAAGGLVQNAAFSGGRRPPHATTRAWRTTDAAKHDLQRAEVLVRAVADLVLEGRTTDVDALRRSVGPRWWDDRIDRTALQRAAEGLHAEAAAWDALPDDGTLRRRWG